MLISETDLVGAATAASKPGKPKATSSSKSGKKPTAPLAPDDEPLVTVATDKATSKMVTVPKRPTRKGAAGNLQTAK